MSIPVHEISEKIGGWETLVSMVGTLYSHHNTHSRAGRGSSQENSRNPVGYIGKAEDIASLVSHLASKEAHFITGMFRYHP